MCIKFLITNENIILSCRNNFLMTCKYVIHIMLLRWYSDKWSIQKHNKRKTLKSRDLGNWWATNEHLMSDWWATDERLMSDWWVTDERLMSGWWVDDERLINDDLLMIRGFDHGRTDGRTYRRTTLVVKSLSRLKSSLS